MYIIIQKGQDWGIGEFRENDVQRASLCGVRYFRTSGGLAELVDCTGLENRRAERYRGFESLSLRFSKNVRLMRTFFICQTLRVIPQSCCFRNRSLVANLNT